MSWTLHQFLGLCASVKVATPRVRTAAKAEIPHLDDHVSKLHAVGNMTQNKLQDISAAATAVGIYNIRVPHNTVTKGKLHKLQGQLSQEAASVLPDRILPAVLLVSVCLLVFSRNSYILPCNMAL